MQETGTKRPYDLFERTSLFARDIRVFAHQIPKTIANYEDLKQLIRSSGSVGANYIEASEGLSRKDFLKHLRIARKEAKESAYWLQLLDVQKKEFNERRLELYQEAKELLMILTSIIHKSP